MKKMSKGKKIFFVVLSVVMLIALLLSFEPVADKVGEVVNVAGDRIKDVARTVLAVGVAVFLINVGVAALSIPIVGITLIVVGVAILAYSLFPYFKQSSPE
jgi:hypothetical protein